VVVAADSLKGKRRKPMAKGRTDSVTGLQWAVFLLGILVTPIAIHAASVMALSGPEGPTLLYPFVQIVKAPAMKVPADLANSVSQWIMYLQFPLYGLLAARLLRLLGVAVGVGAAALLHCIGIGIVYLLTQAQNLRF
jgi:hypothetical protein